jgi:hypothetical protein
VNLEAGMLGKSKLAESVKAGVTEAGLLVRAALALSGVALLVACAALIVAVKVRARSAG